MYKFELKNDILFIYLEGNIDSTNASLCEENILSIISQNTFNYLLIDGQNLSYISSAGLRIILKLMRSYKKMEIINLSNEVYDIFDMTGFTKMMTIRKVFKKIDLDKTIKVGEGAKGIVYRYKDDMIVKVYKDKDALSSIQRERELAKQAFILGLPTAISFDVVKVGDYYGTVFELIDADSMSNKIKEDESKIDEYAYEFVSLLKKINSINVEKLNLRSQMSLVNIWLKNVKNVVDLDLFNKIEKLVNTIHETHTLIHGDYHTNNLMMTKEGIILIDMDTLSYGNPIIELATIDFTYNTFNEIDENNSKHFLGISKDAASKFYAEIIRYYFDGKSNDVINKNRDRIQFLSLIRVLNHVYKRDKESPFISEAVIKIKNLANKLDDLNLE